jgi:biopolymer transport protein ExbD
MAFAAAASTRAPASEMNVTPLVDVMLVLLIIFMVTAPMLSKQIQIDLPQACRDCPPPKPADTMRISIDATGQVALDGRPVTLSALDGMLQLEAQRSPQPLIEIEAVDDAPYARMAEVLAAARNAELQKIGFVE